jgi:hypothetical protein
MKFHPLAAFAFVALLPHFGQAQSVVSTMKKLPDTGQNTSYTNTFGEDNDYSINPQKFSVKNGIVMDSVTTLNWQQTDGGEMLFDNAKNYCDTLTFGGFTDWRLPHPDEAFSILNFQTPSPAIDSKYFTKTGAEYWWTSALQVNDATKAWVTNAGGGIGNHLKTETISAGGIKKFHTRCVRETQISVTITARFLDNGDGTILDRLTDLTWEKSINQTAVTWEDAILYSEGLTLGGNSDWRLPNVKEIKSLSDENKVQPSVNNTMFSGVTITKYWSSTSLPNQSTKAWYLDNNFGITTYDVKTATHSVWAVRGGNTSPNSNTSEIKKSEIHIYPNPFNSHFVIESASDISRIEIYNTAGQLIKSLSSSNQGNKTLSQAILNDETIKNLPTGHYVITLYSPEKIIVSSKIITKENP